MKMLKTIRNIVGRCLGEMRLAVYPWLPFVLYLLPVKKNKVLLINFNGKGYGCNPKYIAQEILDMCLNYDLVWLVRDLHEPFPNGIRKVRYGTVKALYEIATAKVIITNVKNDLHLVKKKDQYVIQTWHGSYSAKYLEKEAADKLMPKYLKESEENSAQTDLFLSNSRILSQCYRDAFWCDCEILECGFPRNDMLFSKDPAQVKQIKERLSVPENCKLVLYAPTFRDDDSVAAYAIDCEGLLRVLCQRGEDWRLLIRLHPNVRECQGLFPFQENIIDATPYPDMQELLLASDMLITDYSSTVFEFAAMRKPIYIFATDIAQYQNMRGLKKDFFDMPYPICKTNQELLAMLRQYDPQTSRRMAEEFMSIYGGVDKGDASKCVVERIRQVVDGT